MTVTQALLAICHYAEHADVVHYPDLMALVRSGRKALDEQKLACSSAGKSNTSIRTGRPKLESKHRLTAAQRKIVYDPNLYAADASAKLKKIGVSMCPETIRQRRRANIELLLRE